MSRHRILWNISLLAFILFSLPNLFVSAQERRTDQAIGNGSYKSGPLPNPVNDVNDIAEALRNLGFTVIRKRNSTQREMEKAIRKFGKNLRKHNGVGLFYYAGHGIRINGRNSLACKTHLSIGWAIQF